jgi:hypothetical protein
MARKHYLVGGAAALITAAVFAACSSSKEVTVQTPVDPMFKSYVSLGNSVTAGWQSGGINDSTQVEAYPVIFAHAANTRFAIPSLAKPGCPPPIDNFLTQSRVGGLLAPPCALRTDTSITSFINNVAVPGAATVDPTGASTANSNALTTFILGGQTQVQRAALANPTFLSVWIGNNDVLAAALSGLLTPVPGLSPGVTSQVTFVANYHAMVSQIKAIPGVKGGVLFAVLNVTQLPTMFQASLLVTSAADLATFEAAAGGPVAVDPSCANPVPLVNFSLAGAIHLGLHPPIVICKKGVLPFPVGDLYVLDSVEVPAVTADINAYNTYIHAVADSLGWAYVDVNPTLANLRLAGLVPAFPVLSPTSPFGTYFSLDGIHPSGLAQVAIADTMAAYVNAKYGTAVPSP